MLDEEKVAQIKCALENWERENAGGFQKERKKKFLYNSGVPIKRLYTPLDLLETGFSYLEDLGFPGGFPYTRGMTATMHRGEAAKVTATVGRGTPQATNKLLKDLIAGGADFFYLVYDMATQMGYDPDNPMADGEVGRIGISLTSQKDWEVLFDGIDVGMVKIGQVANAHAAVGVANHLVLAEKQGVDWKRLWGHCQNDILKDYYARGTYIFPPEHGVRLVTDIMSYCAKHAPNYTPLEISIYQVAENNGDVALQAASGLASIFTYYQNAVNRGLDIDSIASRACFLTSCTHVDFFEEIAKHRALRKIYAKVMKDRFKVKKFQSLQLELDAYEGGTTVYREQCLNNIARGGMAALAIILSGSQIGTIRTYDEQYGIPSEEALAIAIRTLHIVTHETGIVDTIDPLGGSYFIESLTKELEKKIGDELETIEKLGGVIKCIENGYFRRRLMESAYKWQKAFESGEILRVGVNCFRGGTEERPVKVYRASSGVQEERIAEVQELRRRRDNNKVRKALNDIKMLASSKATEENNLMPAVIEAVRAYATTGEICDTLREVWGEYVEPAIL